MPNRYSHPFKTPALLPDTMNGVADSILPDPSKEGKGLGRSRPMRAESVTPDPRRKTDQRQTWNTIVVEEENDEKKNGRRGYWL